MLTGEGGRDPARQALEREAQALLVAAGGTLTTQAIGHVADVIEVLAAQGRLLPAEGRGDGRR